MTSYSSKIAVKDATLSYAQYLFELAVSKNGRKSWQATLLFPKNRNLGALEQLALEACEKEWPGKAKEWIKSGVIKSPFLDGDGKQGKNKSGEQKLGYAGHTFIRCSSGEDHRPLMFDRQVLPTNDRKLIYSGALVNAVVFAYTWDNTEQGKGVSFGVSMIQHAGDGPKLGGDVGNDDPTSYLEKIADEGETPAAAKTGQGAAGLFG